MRLNGCRIHPIVATLAVLGILTGCSAPTSVPTPTLLPVVDRSPFAGNECSAPCWHGLVIGESTETEVRSRLTTLTTIDQGTIQYLPRNSISGLAPGLMSGGLEIQASFIRPRLASLILSLARNVLARIEIMLIYPISAGEAVAELGPPDFVGYQWMGAETMSCEVVLIWHSKQLVLNSPPEEMGNSSPRNNCEILRDSGRISPDVGIQQVSYLTIPWIKQWLNGDGSYYYRFAGFGPGK